MASTFKFDCIDLDNAGLFARVEKKYRIDTDKINAVLPELLRHTHEDKYGPGTISSIYYDTPDWRLIRTSIEQPVYKEKLRLRCYGVPGGDTTVYIEIKKKFQGIGYKRRLPMPYNDALAFLGGKAPAPDNQIGREIAYALRFYPHIAPAALIIYERFALYDNNDPNVRITFDTDLRYRMRDFDMTHEPRGKPILPPGRCVMEIKTSPFSMPVWLSGFLDKHRFYPGRFSKVGMAYTIELTKHLGGCSYANVYTQRNF